MSSHEDREREIEERMRRVQERLDRLVAFRVPAGRDLEQRVQDLERTVHVLTAQFPLLIIATSDNKVTALEKIEAMLDRAEQGRNAQ